MKFNKNALHILEHGQFKRLNVAFRYYPYLKMSWMGILSFKNSTQQLLFLRWIGFIVYPDVLDTWTYLWLRRDGHNIGEFETKKTEEEKHLVTGGTL